MYSTCGVHPHDSAKTSINYISKLREIAKNNKEIVSIGECGLDFDRNFSPQEIQIRVFEEQIDLAFELKLPLFLHERKASKTFQNICMKKKDKIISGCVHCFTGTKEELEWYIDFGFYIGITGWICDERRGKDLQSILNKIPLDKLMVLFFFFSLLTDIISF